MKPFLSENFLLENDFSALLFHEFAAGMPIIDYHNHLPPADIAENRAFPTITAAWLGGDHYKWRAMRTFGIAEDYITGKAPDREKFLKWSEVVPYTVRNPLYHWTHLELKRYFDIDGLLNRETATSIYEQCNEQLVQEAYHTRGLLDQMNVEILCTTDDPCDELLHHQAIATSDCAFEVRPTFRPDQLYDIGRPTYRGYLQKLGELTGLEITSVDQLLEAAETRVDYFHRLGGRLSDHSFEQLYDVEISLRAANQTLSKVLNQELVAPADVKVFQMTLLVELCKMYHRKGWTQQFHLGALRNNSTRAAESLGPDTGFDSLGDCAQARGLQKFLDTLDRDDQLARTILYNINPKDNEVFATMAGNFNDGSVAGKIQHGSGWWFLDQKDGMEKQMNSLSNMGLLSQFIGMLTDSRSFLSFPRHEYFRRVLCNLIGRDVANGELPADEKLLGGIVQDICYNNAKRYLKLDL